MLRTHDATLVAGHILKLGANKLCIEMQLQVRARAIPRLVLHLDHVRPGVFHLCEGHLLAMKPEKVFQILSERARESWRCSVA